MTYPDERVIEFLNRELVCFQADISKPRPELRELFRRARPLWAPMFLVFDSRGAELRRWTGWLDPAAFLDELALALTLAAFSRNDPERALDYLERAGRTEGLARAEALYWRGVALYKKGRGDLHALSVVWKELRDEFPSSTWAMRADVMEFADSGDRPPVRRD